MDYKYLIIGGGVAGTTAGEVIRRKDSGGSLAIIAGENYPLYSRISLYDYVANPEYGDKIFLRKLENYKDKNIDLLLGVSLEKLDFKRKTAGLSDGRVVGFEKILLSSGGIPTQMAIEGNDGRVFYYQSLDDAKKIKENMPDLKRVAVIGASFAGFELVELFRQFGVEVDMFVRRQFVGGAFDARLEDYIKNILKDKKVNLKLGLQVGDIVGGDSGVTVTCGDGKFEYDGVAIAVGLKRNLDIFRDAGVNCENGILADEFLRTNIDGVFSAGDVVEYFDTRDGRNVVSGSWTGAFMQGKIAGENMTGENNVFRLMPTYTCSIFDDQFTFLGSARDAGEQFEKISRDDLKNGKYTILYLEDGVIKGAVSMNANAERGVLSALIEKKIDVGKHKDSLGNMDFKLEELL